MQTDFSRLFALSDTFTWICTLLDPGKNQLVLDAIGPFKPSNAVFAVKIIFKYLRLELQRILHSLPLFLSVLHSIPPFVSTCRGSVQAIPGILSSATTVALSVCTVHPFAVRLLQKLSPSLLSQRPSTHVPEPAFSRAQSCSDGPRRWLPVPVRSSRPSGLPGLLWP